MKKSDIITYYLNNVLFSDNIYGIYNASLYFFNKTALFKVLIILTRVNIFYQLDFVKFGI